MRTLLSTGFYKIVKSNISICNWLSQSLPVDYNSFRLCLPDAHELIAFKGAHMTSSMYV